MITDSQLQHIMPSLPVVKRQLYLPPLNAALAAYEVDTLLRSAAFIAQIAHESGELRWMEEIWGPTPAQRRYEPPNELAARLGNTQPGDGARYKGRGPIQITGRANYELFGHRLGIDLIAQPTLAAEAAHAFATAGVFWQSNGLNELADAGDFEKITRRINGGLNGLAERQRYYALVQSVLTVTATRGRGAATPERHPAPGRAVLAPVTRGHEAIAAMRDESSPPEAARPAARAARKRAAGTKSAKGTAVPKRAAKG